jgi:hypothetical protein
MKQYGFNSTVWDEQKLQMVNELRAVFTNKTLSVEDKANFGNYKWSKARQLSLKLTGRTRPRSEWCSHEWT